MTLLTIILLFVAIGLCIARFFFAERPGKLTAAALLCIILIQVLSEGAKLSGLGR
jgi:hypothetical protein